MVFEIPNCWGFDTLDVPSGAERVGETPLPDGSRPRDRRARRAHGRGGPRFRSDLAGVGASWTPAAFAATAGKREQYCGTSRLPSNGTRGTRRRRPRRLPRSRRGRGLPLRVPSNLPLANVRRCSAPELPPTRRSALQVARASASASGPAASVTWAVSSPPRWGRRSRSSALRSRRSRTLASRGALIVVTKSSRTSKPLAVNSTHSYSVSSPHDLNATSTLRWKG